MEKKKILIFGETHVKSEPCPNLYCDYILNFITNLISETDKNNKCIDFFVEQALQSLDKNAFVPSKKYFSCCDINDLRDYLMNCNTEKGKICKIDGIVRNNVRVQNFDLRFVKKDSTEFMLLHRLKYYLDDKYLEFKSNNDKEFLLNFV